MPELVELTVEGSPGGTVVVTATGELDISSSPKLKDTLVDVIAGGASAIVVDLGPTSFLDSSALAALLHSWRAASACDTPMVVVSPFEHVTRIFELTGISRTVPIFKTMAEAQAHLVEAAS